MNDAGVFSSVVASYVGAAVAAVAAQAVVQGSDPNLFAPACVGAGVAALRTVLPAFTRKNGSEGDPPSAVFIRAFISLTAGFGVGFYGTHDILGVFSESLRPSPGFGAMIIAGAGEFFFALATEKLQRGFGGKGGA